MKKQILLTLLLALTVALSLSAVAASDVNVTDSHATSLVDDTSDASVPQLTADSSDSSVSSDSNVDNNDPSKVSLSSEEVLESGNSNTLSTNTNSNASLGSTNDADKLSAAKSTVLTAPTTSVYYKNPFSVVLKDGDGKAVVGEKVNFVIGGKSYTRTTDGKGVASVDLTLAPGKYTTTVSYGGSANKYAAAKKLSITLNVLATVKASDVTKYYKGSKLYSATFVDGQGRALANTDVRITVNGQTSTKRTNSKGVVSLGSDFKPGTYKISAVDPISGYKATNTLKVLSTITSKDISKVYTDSRQFTATFYKSSGKALAKKTVRFTIDGKNYYVRTDSNGVASISLTDLTPGTHKIVSYNPKNGQTVSNTIKVVKKAKTKIVESDYTFYTYDAVKKFKIKLHNQFGYAPSAGKTIIIKIDGKKYYKTTNSFGKVKVKLPNLSKGVYTIKYIFGGDDYYYGTSAKGKITIIPSKNPDYIIKSTKTFGKGAYTPFKVALTSKGVPLEKRTVVLKVDGKYSYTKTTNANGIVSLPINLALGKHTITYTNKADSKVVSKTGSTTITVKERSPSKIAWKSAKTFYQGAETYKVLLTDSNGKALANKVVKLTVNSKTYSVKTSSKGYATFKVTLNVNPGTYSVSYKFAGDNDFLASSGSYSISVLKKVSSKSYGYWLFGGDMKKVDINSLASAGTTDIFLNYYAFTAHSKSDVTSWIAKANKAGIRVHIWMQTFYDGSWVNPVKNGAPDTALFNKIINQAKGYAQISGVAGIHFDYLRYPGNAYKTSGGTAAISKFASMAATQLHKVNPNLIVSAALMPETTNNIYYYGQDLASISKSMDVVVPMIYKGNYGKSSSWITSTTKWFVSNSKGAKVWSGLQGYKSDSDVTKLSTSAMTTDVKSAINGNAAGAIIFRWGVTNFVTFKSISAGSSSSSSGPSSISINDILSGASSLKTYYEKYGKLPSTVTAAKHAFTVPEFLYLMDQAIYNLGNSKTGAIKCIYGVKAPSSPSGDTINSANLYKAKYLTVAKNVANYISKNKQAPNYASSAVGKIKYAVLVDASARILTFYKNNNKYMPNYVVIKSSGSSSSSVSAGGLNVKNTIKDLSPYLKATANCQVGNSAIKSIVNKLTSGLTTDTQKATAIYNYVRDYVSYSFYYDTNYGALGTLNHKTGNCVDQAHLLVAMYRTAGLAARYEHGTCYFTSSGSTYGHVWAQVLVNNVWVVSDPTSSRNSFGVVNNWNTNSYSHHAYYASLPF